MRRMPAVDWKQWAMDMPNWVKDMVESAFDKFLEYKWKDALNVTAAKLSGWGTLISEPKKMTANKESK